MPSLCLGASDSRCAFDNAPRDPKNGNEADNSAMSEAEGMTKSKNQTETAGNEPKLSTIQLHGKSPSARRRKTGGTDHLITLKAMVDGAGTTPRAVRFYEAEKLISAAQRSTGGHRLFEVGELEKLKLIIDLRSCGFSIEEIRELLAARQTSPSKESAMALQGLLAQHMDGLKRKLQLMAELDREFQSAIVTLDRCATCEDPRGKEDCLSCDVLISRTAPRCIRFL